MHVRHTMSLCLGFEPSLKYFIFKVYVRQSGSPTPWPHFGYGTLGLDRPGGSRVLLLLAAWPGACFQSSGQCCYTTLVFVLSAHWALQCYVLLTWALFYSFRLMTLSLGTWLTSRSIMSLGSPMLKHAPTVLQSKRYSWHRKHVKFTCWHFGCFPLSAVE